jgi:hypothetical protein
VEGSVEGSVRRSASVIALARKAAEEAEAKRRAGPTPRPSIAEVSSPVSVQVVRAVKVQSTLPIALASAWFQPLSIRVHSVSMLHLVAEKNCSKTTHP